MSYSSNKLFDNQNITNPTNPLYQKFTNFNNNHPPATQQILNSIYSQPNEMKRSNVFTTNFEKASIKHSKSGQGLQNFWTPNKTNQIDKSNNVELSNDLDKFKSNSNKQLNKDSKAEENKIFNTRSRKLSGEFSRPNNMYSSHIISSSSTQIINKTSLQGLARFVKQVINDNPNQESTANQTQPTKSIFGNSFLQKFTNQMGVKKFTPLIPSISEKKYQTHNLEKEITSPRQNSIDSQKNKFALDFSKLPVPPSESKSLGIGNFQKSNKSTFSKERENPTFLVKSPHNIIPQLKSNTPNIKNLDSNLKLQTVQFNKNLQIDKNQNNQMNYPFHPTHLSNSDNNKNPNLANPFKKDKSNYQPSAPIPSYTPPPPLPEKKQFYQILAKKTAERLQSKKNIQINSKIYNPPTNLPSSPSITKIQEIPSTNLTSPSNFKLKKGFLSYSVPTNIQPQNLGKKISHQQQKKPSKNDFVIGKKLGKGKFGQVFIVKHKLTGFICALKVIPKKLIKEEKVQLQFSRQLQIQFYLNHQNITALYGNFDDLQNVYLLLELCAHGQLFNVLKEKRRLSEEETSELLKQICNGVQYMHRQRIIHRDLKPQNIIMQNGVPKICDFGWAVFRGDGLRQTFCGTPLYVSPQILKGEKYDQKIDLWSIGILCYQLLVGKIPFKINSENDLMKIINEQIKFPDYIAISDIAKDFILKILKKNPQERIQIEQIMSHEFLKEKKIGNDFIVQINNLF